MRLTFDTFGNEKQKECCRAWCDDTVTDIYYGGAKGGAKSFTGVNLIFADALTYPDTRYFISRNKLNDLRKFTIPTISKVFNNWGIPLTKYATFNGSDNFYQCYNGSKVLLLEAAYMPSDPLYERFGSMEFTRGWIEESGEFDKPARNNLAASIGRWKNEEYNLKRKLLQTGNPSKNYTYSDYYRPFKDGKLKDHQRFIQAFIQDNKKIDKGYEEQLLQNLSPSEIERLLYGNWEFDSDPTTLMPYENILDIFTNTHVKPGAKKITCDVARMGGDKIVMIEWNGWRGKVKWWRRELLDISGARIEEARYSMGIGNSDVLIDEDGMGAGIVDFLKFKGFVNNSSPLPSPTGPVDENNRPIKENYDNLKSQCYFHLADRVNRKELYLECDNEEVKKWIIEELEQVKAKAVDSDLKKGVVPKDRVKEKIGRSPDFADCFEGHTKILTPFGEKNIKDIIVGDYVVTPNGNRRVKNVIEKKSMELHCINNKILCTGNHRFISKRGIISADSLMINDYICGISILDLWKSRFKRLLSTKERNTGFLKQILNIIMPTFMSQENVLKSDFIDRNTKIRTGQYLPVMMFITSIQTLLTTMFLIWKRLKNQFIGLHIKRKGWQTTSAGKQQLRHSEIIQKKLLHGIKVSQVKSGIASTVKNRGNKEQKLQENVFNAMSNSNHSESTLTFAAINAGSKIDTLIKPTLRKGFVNNAEVLSKFVNKINQVAVQENVVVYLQEPETVYTLNVENDNVYYANGLLVENCIMMREYFELNPKKILAWA